MNGLPAARARGSAKRSIRKPGVFQPRIKSEATTLAPIVALLAVLLAGCSSSAVETGSESPARIVTVGGSVTETAFALGAGDLVVATDTSSIFPEQATKLPQIGYQRSISAEGVISQNPTLLLVSSEAGPPPALRQIESSGIKVVNVENENTIDGARAQIRTIAEALGRKPKGEELIRELDNRLKDAQKCVESIEEPPKVLFIYARGAGAVNVSGSGTAADSMIALSGGENAIDGFEGFKPLTPESLVAAAPDVILIPERAMGSIGGLEGVKRLPGISDTPAFRNGRFVVVDDLLLLVFSPRLGDAVLELCTKLRG
ncbi:MAG: hemin ABC transporter substrate-binding protein [Aridibacter famidurans]|nr:hemin ABC transporter substrate-binding protein [Aridibacter famidurans]